MANTFTQLLYHIVFSTKERRPLIKPERAELKRLLAAAQIAFDGKYLL